MRQLRSRVALESGRPFSLEYCNRALCGNRLTCVNNTDQQHLFCGENELPPNVTIENAMKFIDCTIDNELDWQNCTQSESIWKDCGDSQDTM